MTDLKIDYQLPDEVRASLGTLVAEFASAQPVPAIRDRYDRTTSLPGIVSALHRYAEDWRYTGNN